MPDSSDSGAYTESERVGVEKKNRGRVSFGDTSRPFTLALRHFACALSAPRVRENQPSKITIKAIVFNPVAGQWRLLEARQKKDNALDRASVNEHERSIPIVCFRADDDVDKTSRARCIGINAFAIGSSLSALSLSATLTRQWREYNGEQSAADN